MTLYVDETTGQISELCWVGSARQWMEKGTAMFCFDVPGGVEKEGPNEVDGDWLSEAIGCRRNVPAGESGDHKIVHKTVKKGESVTVVSLRDMMMTGCKSANMAFDRKSVIRELVYEGGTWMTDSPQEIWQMKEALDGIWDSVSDVGGKVLIGGLGLGCFQTMLDRMAPEGGLPDEVTTIEISKDVVDLVWRHVAGHRKLLVGDVYKIAKKIKPGEYDVAFMDTWQMTGEWCWIKEVVPLRRLLRQKVQRLFCWVEGHMACQIRRSCLRGMCLPLSNTEGQMSLLPCWIARQAALNDGADVPEFDMKASMADAQLAGMQREVPGGTSDEELGVLWRMTTDVGSKVWEDEFGELWDKGVELCGKIGKKKAARRA